MRLGRRLKKKIEKNVDREKLVYEAGKCKYDFRNFNTIKTFDEDIYITEKLLQKKQIRINEI